MKFDSIKKRVANHDAYIMANKSFFDMFFLPENWHLMTFGKIKNNVGSVYATKEKMKSDLIIVGKILKQEFQYGCRTNPIDIILHFKRRYNKLYQE